MAGCGPGTMLFEKSFVLSVNALQAESYTVPDLCLIKITPRLITSS
jgi:hypothetical protein